MGRMPIFGLVLTATLQACRDAPEPPPPEPAVQGVHGRAPAAAQGISSVVTLRPSSDVAAEPMAGPAVMDQLGLAFLPSALIARPGQTLRFTNSETLVHNVHVTRIENDSTVYLADTDPGDSVETELSAPGGYDVTCDEHPGMRAVIYVTSAPYATFAEADGSFVLPDVPPGSYQAEVWLPTTGVSGPRAVEVSGPSTEVDLTGLP